MPLSTSRGATPDPLQGQIFYTNSLTKVAPGENISKYKRKKLRFQSDLRRRICPLDVRLRPRQKTEIKLISACEFVQDIISEFFHDRLDLLDIVLKFVSSLDPCDLKRIRL